MTVIKDPGKEVSNKAVKGKAMFGRKLRDISPKKEKSGLKGDLVNPNSDGDWQTTNGMDKIASMHNVQKWPLHIGDGVDEEPFTVATVSGKDGRKLAPDVGFKNAPESLKKARGIQEELDGDGTTHHYHVVDKHTKSVVGKAKNLRSAIRMVDKRDNAYGAYRYTHKRVEGPHPSMAKKSIKEELVSIAVEGFFDEINERLELIDEAFGKALGPNTQSNDNSEESWTGKNYQKPVKKPEKFNALKFRKQHLQKEEVEEIDELSVTKLRDYANKAWSEKDKGGKDRKKGTDLAVRKVIAAKIGGHARVPGTDYDKARIKEDVEGLDEISVRKVNRYMDRAEDDLSHRISDGAGGRVPEDQHRAHRRKVNNRSRGLNTALDKLTVGKHGPIAKVRATESIEELSSDTLNSYKGKSFVDQHRGGDRSRPFSDSDQRKYRKRGAGQAMARAKMNGTAKVCANEGTELDEMVGKKKVPEIKRAWSRSRDINDRLARDSISRGEIRGASKYHKKAEDAESKASRADGILNRIRTRRVNEDHLEEISDVAKSSYLDAARKDRDKVRKELTDSSNVNPHTLKRLSKRVMGIDRAKGENNG